MAGSSDIVWETGLMLLLFNNTTFTTVGDAAGLLKSAADGSLFVSLHTADPAGGNQTTSEAAYTDYARVAVSRAAAGTGWTCVTNTATNTAAVTFPVGTGGGEHVTHFAIGTVNLAGGAGKLLYTGEVTPHLDTGIGVIPTFAIGAIDISQS